MNKTKEYSTPGGNPGNALNNPPSNEAGPKDFGEGHLLHDFILEDQAPIPKSKKTGSHGKKL